MKWNEMTAGQKILLVIGLFCAIAYLVLILLDLFDVWAAPKALSPALFGVFWVLNASLQKNKKTAICYYILGAAWLLFSLARLFT